MNVRNEIEQILEIDTQCVIDRLTEIRSQDNGLSKPRKTLPDRQEFYLWHALRGWSLEEIVYKRTYHKDPNPAVLKQLDLSSQVNTWRKDMNESIDRYIKQMMNLQDKPSWAKVINFLRENGFTLAPISTSDEIILELPKVVALNQQLFQGIQRLQNELGIQITIQPIDE
jgi:hypothetical protein